MSLSSEPDVAGITCRESVRLVSLLRDNEISSHEQEQLSTHLQDCERCQMARQQFTSLYALIDKLLDYRSD